MNDISPHISSLDSMFYGISIKEVVSLLEETGSMIQEMRSKGITSKNKIDLNDIVTEADIAAQNQITIALKKALPEAKMFGEESTEIISGELLKKGLWFVLDPIDGTSSFKMGRSDWCISLALLVNGEIKISFIHAPDKHETFFAVKDLGSYQYINGVTDKLPKLPSITSLKGAHVAAGPMILMHKMTQKEKHALDMFSLEEVQTLRLGTAALEITYVARGMYHTFFETVKPWDIAGARLIASEVGCEFFSYTPENLTFSLFPPELNAAGFCVCHPGLATLLKGFFNISEGS